MQQEIYMDKPGEKQDEIKKPFKQHPSTLAGNAPLRAARGDDDVMSQPPQPQQQSMPGEDEVKGKWKQDVGHYYAKIARGKLAEDELLKSEGHAQKLTGLAQERRKVRRDNHVQD